MDEQLSREELLSDKDKRKRAELEYFNRSHQFCGFCGAPMEWSTDISKRCTKCGEELWPRIQPAVITLITRGEEMLLVHAKTFRSSQMFGLVAGFVETGETLEEAVQREIIEEVGVKVKNIRYFGSQSWPFPTNIMIGFTAEYDSSICGTSGESHNGEIRLQESEISAGGWFKADNLPEIPKKYSIARKLIDNFLAQLKEKP